MTRSSRRAIEVDQTASFQDTIEDSGRHIFVVEYLAPLPQGFLGGEGFRPGRSQHQALAALYTGLLTRKVNWVLDLDIHHFFDGLSHEWLVKFIEHRIADRRVVRLIQKWLNAGVLEDGKRIRVEEGTPQGGSASPLLANVYLHYGAPGQTWCFQRVKFPPRQEVQPPHRESSLGSEEITNRRFLQALGRNDEAMKQMAYGAELNPMDVGIREQLGMVTYAARQYDSAISLFKQLNASYPG